MDFIEINKINSYGEKGVAFVRKSDIMGINQKHVEGTKLYDESGNLVSETPATTQDYVVLVQTERGNQEKFHIDEVEYARLVAELNK